MAAKTDVLFKIAYCKSHEGGDWDDVKPWESLEKIDDAMAANEKIKPPEAHYAGSTAGLHAVLAWSEGMYVEEQGKKAPGQLAGPKPGLTYVTLNANLVPVGMLYEAFTCMAANGGLVNYKLYFIRNKFPKGSKESDRLHHFFTVTGIAARIVSLNQQYGGSEGAIQLTLQPNRISYCDHDSKNAGGVLYWAEKAKMPDSFFG